MSVIVDITEAVTAELNEAPEGTFAEEFEAVRAYVPVYDLAEMKDLHVTVVPRGVESERASRSMIQHDIQVDVAVQRKINNDSDVDGLMTLTQQIADHLAGRRLTGRADAVCLRVENMPVYSVEHLSELRQFTSLLTVTYRVVRE